MEAEYKQLALEDLEEITRLCRLEESRSCENNFTNMYLWGNMYPLEYKNIDNVLVIKDVGSEGKFRFPIGDHAHLRTAVDRILFETGDHCEKLMIWGADAEQFERLEKLYPGKFQIRYDDAHADYVYEREKLATLSGKRYHGKKNHVNKFVRLYPDWSYERITGENIDECIAMANEWRETRIGKFETEEEIGAEFDMTIRCLEMIDALQLTGGLLRVNGKVCAFSVGEAQSSDTFVVHIEKALDEYEGAYSMINQQFVLHETDGYMYVNREDDADDPGLRKAKQSYHPVMMVEKGMITLIQEGETR